jgi:formylmethanofuran dehydrogenase subunit E
LAETNPEMAPEIIDEAPLVIEDQTQQLKKISRTTQWRKMAKELRGEVAQVKKPRKEYSCNKCNQPMTSDGHTQLKGKRFCSATEGKSKEQWLAEMKIVKSN